MSSYFGSHSSGGKIRVTNSSDLLAALKIQTIYKSNQSNPKSRIRTAGHADSATIYGQYNSVIQQINYGVEKTQIFQALPPGVPTSVVASRGNASATISWQAPSSDGGSPITSYVVIATQSGTDLTPQYPGDLSRVYTFTGLTNGLAYTFRVAAINRAGQSDYSTSSIAVTPQSGTPSVPSTPTVYSFFDGGGNKANVSWTAPNNGGSTITSYTVYAWDKTSPGVTAAASQVVSGSPASTSLNFTGLTNGRQYNFTVKARNTNGDSGISSHSENVTIFGATNVATSITATGGDERAFVSWTAPVDLQGATINKWHINVYESDGTTLATLTSPYPNSFDTGDDSRVFTVSGLVNGQTYKIGIASLTQTVANAQNSPYTSAEAKSASVTANAPVSPPLTPGPPNSLAAGFNGATTGQQVYLSWSAPSSPNNELDYYEVSYAPTGADVTTIAGRTTNTSFTVRSGDPGITISSIELTNGVSYTFYVNAYKNGAINPVGDAASVSFTPAAIPVWSSITGITGVTPGVGELILQITPPDTSGSEVTAYKLYGGLTNVVGSASLISSPGSPYDQLQYFTVNVDATPNANGNTPTYYFWLKATNAAGDSLYSDVASGSPVAVTPPFSVQPVTGVTCGRVSGSATSLTVSFVDGNYYPNYGITPSYTVTATNASTGGTVTATLLNSGEPIGSLTPGDLYTVTVVANFGSDSSSASQPSIELAPSDVPSIISAAPSIVSSGDGEVVISWTAPASDLPITGFSIVSITPDETAANSVFGISGVSPGDTVTRSVYVTNGNTYQFSVAAGNAVGLQSTYSPSSDSAAPLAPGPPVPPDPPVLTAVTAGSNRTLTAYWTPPTNTGSSPLTGYWVYVQAVGSGSPKIRIFIGNPLTTTYTTSAILTNYVNYSVWVTATNGNNLESVQSNSITEYPLPPVPPAGPPSEIPQVFYIQVRRLTYSPYHQSILTVWKRPTTNFDPNYVTGYNVYASIVRNGVVITPPMYRAGSRADSLDDPGVVYGFGGSTDLVYYAIGDEIIYTIEPYNEIFGVGPQLYLRYIFPGFNVIPSDYIPFTIL